MMIKKSLLLACITTASCHAAVPSQFIAKQYTEAMGRAPDPVGWQGFTNYAVSQGCSANTLKNISLGFFDSAEYKAKGYTPEETVLTAYRAVFSREPDPSGFTFFVNYLKSGHTIVEALPIMFSSQELNDMVPAICAGEAYGPIGTPKQAMDIGSGAWTQAQLESCIANNMVCNIPPRTVVYLNSTLTIPNGKTVQTQGSYDRTMYARQARIVRNSSVQGILIVMQPASVVRNIWVSGGRDLYKGSLVRSNNPQDNVFPNINYVGGNYGAIIGVRSDAPLAATHIATFPVPTPSIPTSPTAFQGSIAIQNNLTTGYAQNHYLDGTPVAWADGISNHITNATITGNDIVDPTDVGIVLFGHDGSTQTSTASNNVIVHSGHSAYGSLGLDATQCLGSANACRFSGSGYTNNKIFAGEKQHSDILLFNGTGAWAPPSCNGVLDKYCATGGQMSNNTSILGDATQTIQTQVSMAVDGMLNAVMSGNNLSVKPVPPGSTMRCRTSSTAPMVLYALSKGHASGSLQAGSDGDIDQCIGH